MDDRIPDGRRRGPRDDARRAARDQARDQARAAHDNARAARDQARWAGRDDAWWAARRARFSQAGLAEPVPRADPGDLARLRASRGRGRPGRPLVPTSEASPRLNDELFARLLTYGTPQDIRRGDVLFRPGDEDVDLIV